MSAVGLAAACAAACDTSSSGEGDGPSPTSPDEDAGDARSERGRKPPPSISKDGDPDPDVSASGKKRVFVTSDTYPGDLVTAGKGLNAFDSADNLCAAAAKKGQLGGTWRAWISASTGNAIDRIKDVGPWYLVDRTTLVFEKRSSISQLPLHAIDQDETGAPAQTESVWTGTAATGKWAYDDCANWTDSADEPNAEIGCTGKVHETTLAWTFGSTSECLSPKGLYCFEQ